uniref:XLR/SYCP3/FAM9 domain-containing protein n=1 Tax=Oryctolagus cuniculus TaxID=9986 RepID=U3KPL9_RABIT
MTRHPWHGPQLLSPAPMPLAREPSLARGSMQPAMAPESRKRFREASATRSKPSHLEAWNLRHQAGNPGIDPHGNSSASAGAAALEVEVGDDAQKVSRGRTADVQLALPAKRRRRTVNADNSPNATKEKFEQILKVQKEQWQNIRYSYSRQFLTFFEEWDTGVRKTAKQQERLTRMLHDHRRLFLQAKNVQMETLTTVKNLYEEFLKGINDLELSQQSLLTDEQKKLKNEIDILKNKIIAATEQQQELASIQQSLQAMLLL